MKKRNVIILSIICILCTVLGYIQYGQDEEVVSSRNLTFANGYVLDIALVVNRPYITDEKGFAREMLKKCMDNSFQNILFSNDWKGYPNGLNITVYLDKRDWETKTEAFHIHYVSKLKYLYNIKEQPEKFSIKIESCRYK